MQLKCLCYGTNNFPLLVSETLDVSDIFSKSLPFLIISSYSDLLKTESREKEKNGNI